MRMMNLDPFWRTSVGFDRLFDLMDESLRYEPEGDGSRLATQGGPCRGLKSRHSSMLDERSSAFEAQLLNK
jgi:hypothetical protein